MNQVTRMLMAGAIAFSCAGAGLAGTTPLGSSFTYQGQLRTGGAPVNGTADFQFTLWEQSAGGSQVGGMIPVNLVTVSDGTFTTSLDFGVLAFDGNDRWLQIAVRTPAGSGSFVTLTPRQRLAPAPYALRALSATIAGLQPNAVDFNNAGNAFTGASLAIDGSTLHVDSVNNRVGIGTATPSVPLHVRTGGAGLGSSGNTSLTLESNQQHYLNMLAPSGNEMGLLFGEPTAGPASGGIVYNNPFVPNGLELRTNGNLTRMVVDSDGQVGIGTFDPGERLTVVSPVTDTMRLIGPGQFGYDTRLRFQDNAGNVYLHNDIDGGLIINVNEFYGGRLALTGGNVGIGTTAPSAQLDIVNDSFDGISNTTIFRAPNLGPNISHVHYAATGDWYIRSAAGTGKVVIQDAGGSVGIGTSAPSAGKLHVANPTGDGTFSESAMMNGRGVFGLGSAATPLSYGVYGQSTSSQGIGVFGDGSRGGYFQSSSTVGRGVVGLNTGATGSPSGVYGECSANMGAGVAGISTGVGALSYGGSFQAVSTIGQGVYGFASHTTGATIGVHGHSASSSASSYGLFATGRIGATGTKSFRIDHPGDPANRYLIHYSAESDEVINFYSGKVTLNGAGEALVDLPAYFSKINRDPRYTLTAIGAAMPNLHVAEEVSEAMLAAEGPCWFRIAGGAPNAKVSWRVEAVRNDAFVRAYGAPVEVDKPEHERGKYQHPELYGQPASAGLNASAAEIFKNHMAPVEPLPVNRELPTPTETP